MKTNLALKLNIQHFATQTFPEPNLQTVPTLDNFKEKSVDFAYRFEQDLIDFQKALGITRLMPVASGMTIELFGKPEVTLANGDVPEGDLIPLSYVTPVVASTKKITLKKYRKATSGEAIQTYGADAAVDITDTALIKEVQNNVRKDLFTLVQSGEAQTNLNTGNGLQGALATVWGTLQTIFEDDTVRPIVFAHPMDVAQAVADKQMTLETTFGLNYYTDLTGTIVFTSTQVERGNVYGTAADNLVIAYIPAGTSDLGQQFGLTSDNTGFIGMKHFLHNETLTQQTLLVSGVLMFPERLDGVVKVPLASAGA
ncbi:phage capsid protein [Macrococcoides goetzii]|uniref:Phage capsid protein n=1 Tax=Macrococcoides goetzii TaxID=1891097 RepID=A0A2G5NUX7_9STAP|nr:phage capsid protein [Macrococcus goetzii]RAI79674.1 phage capsid protein [Macrococcus goetzii]